MGVTVGVGDSVGVAEGVVEGVANGVDNGVADGCSMSKATASGVAEARTVSNAGSTRGCASSSGGLGPPSAVVQGAMGIQAESRIAAMAMQVKGTVARARNGFCEVISKAIREQEYGVGEKESLKEPPTAHYGQIAAWGAPSHKPTVYRESKDCAQF